jgi:hypothetical protein
MTADRPPAAEKYRARARECLESAEKAREPDARRGFEQAAVFWLQMADKLEMADKLAAEKS